MPDSVELAADVKDQAPVEDQPNNSDSAGAEKDHGCSEQGTVSTLVTDQSIQVNCDRKERSRLPPPLLGKQHGDQEGPPVIDSSQQGAPVIQAPVIQDQTKSPEIDSSQQGNQGEPPEIDSSARKRKERSPDHDPSDLSPTDPRIVKRAREQSSSAHATLSSFIQGWLSAIPETEQALSLVSSVSESASSENCSESKVKAVNHPFMLQLELRGLLESLRQYITKADELLRVEHRSMILSLNLHIDELDRERREMADLVKQQNEQIKELLFNTRVPITPARAPATAPATVPATTETAAPSA